MQRAANLVVARGRNQVSLQGRMAISRRLVLAQNIDFLYHFPKQTLYLRAALRCPLPC